MNSHKLNQITQALKQGDNSIIKEWYVTYKMYCVKVLIAKHSCSFELAEDIFTEAVICMRDNILCGKLTELKSVKSYLFAICRNLFLVHANKQKRILERQNDVLRYYYEEVDGVGNQQEQEDITYKLKKVNSVLENMDEKCRTIITSFYLYRNSMEEIAEKMGFASRDVAKTIKGRCFKKLLTLLESLNVKR